MIEEPAVKIQKRGKVKFNPFPGLRPFSVEESHLFFGREGQSDEVLKKLAANRFTAVIGASGSGKSSLMYCGVIPTVYGGFISEASDSWKMVVTRPGNSPIDNLAQAIVESDSDFSNENKEEVEIRKTINSAMLRSSSLGLIEALKQSNKNKKQNILVLIDQFEELFRFKKSAENKNSENESSEFVKLFLEAASQSEVPIYVVLTMRSDFIGDCAQFPSLTEKINDSHYLIPQMTRDDLQGAIEGPVAVGGGAISPHLVQQLLNEVGDNPDQLPILQHALMRTWNAWETSQDAEDMISIDHYDSIGRMEKALSNHANETFDDLSEDAKRICENLFKTLTEKGGDNRGIRRPTVLATVAEICHTSTDDLISIVEIFRATGRSFLSPASNMPLTADTIIDISHESLMRIWDRLIGWVDDEATAVTTYIRIANAAALYQVGKASLWRPPDLQLALNWQEKKQPTLQWAERYDASFERVMVFLKTSKDTYEAEEKNKILLQKRALKRSRIVAIVLGSAAVIALFLTLWAFQLKAEADKQTIAATEAKDAAVLSEKKAEQAAIEAEKAAAEALKQKELADIARDAAEEAKIAAIESKSLAEYQQKLAELAKNKALISEREANKQKGIALEKEKEAQEQTAKAIEAQKTADALRMLSISKAMAIKSANMRRDTTRKALLAYHSYLFNEEYQGEKHNADVYDGLYNTLKFLKEKDYNSLEGHSDAVRSIIFDKNGMMYSTGSDGKVLAWDISASNNPSAVLLPGGAVKRNLAINSDNSSIAIGLENSIIQLLNPNTKEVTELRGHNKSVWAICFDSENKLYSSSADSTLRVWDGEESKILASGSMIRSLTTNNINIAAGLMSDKISIWNKRDGKLIKEIAQEAAVYAVAYNPDGSILVVGDKNGNIKIYNAKTFELINSLRGHTARVHEIEFSKDGKQMATAGFDGSVLLWKATDFNITPINMKDHDSWVWTLAFSPDGQKLIAGCRDNLIRVWPTSTNVMANQICAKLKRNMTQKEWDKYVAKDIPYEKTCDALPNGEGVK